VGLHFIEDFYTNYSIDPAFQAIISLMLVFVLAFLFTRVTKLLKLPNVTAYIIAGIVIGPFALNLIPSVIITNMNFVTDIGLGFIAFGIGRYFNVGVIKKNGLKPLVISLIQSIFTSVLVFFFMMLFKLPFAICLVLASIGGTSSAAVTVMTIKQYRCEGEFINFLMEIIAVDNAVGLLAFSICNGIAYAILGDVSGVAINMFTTVWLPIIINFCAIAVGIIVGFLLAKVIITPSRSKDNRLILTVAVLLALVAMCGLGKIIDEGLFLSPLLCVMALGATYINLTHDEELFMQVSDFAAPILLLFFVLSGVSFNFNYLSTVGVIGLVYFAIRIVGKYFGSYFGGLITKSGKTVTRYVGLALIPQAGVSIGLAVLAARMLDSVPGNYAGEVSAIIISSAILYELVGPASAKFALQKSGCMKEENRLKTEGQPYAVVETASMLKDTAVVQADPSYIKKMHDLQTLKEEFELANRYIHTKKYSEDDQEPNTKDVD
jgi:Kef-type K+ transport system membrane component KefB